MSGNYILLGRTGDILSFLPLLHDEAQSGENPRLMVAAEYAGVLEGVSYVNPVIYDGPHYEIRNAVELGRNLGGEWTCCQINGPADEVLECSYKPAGATGARTTSYQKEEWLLAGKLDRWDDNLPLVIDRRDPEREAALVAALPAPPRGKKVSHQPILVSLGGNSSPFPHRDLLMELVRLKFGRERAIVDLSTIKAERIYDLLGLYERAFCLIATDSAPLHLARAVPGLPVLALTNDRPLLWNGSAWQPQHWFYCRYQDFPARALELLATIGKTWDGNAELVHVWNAYRSGSPATVLGRPCPIQLRQCGRDSQLTLKEGAPVPYLRDCLRMGLRLAPDRGRIVLTRKDTHFCGHQDILGAHDASYAYRMDRTEHGDTFVPIVDLFCATREWWKAHLRELPDLLMTGDWLWSNVLWAMFKQYDAADITGTIYRPATA